jgi:hypothetical protein
MRSKIVALLLLLAIPALADAPLTVDEAAAYIAADPQGAAEDVAKLDAIERAVPVVTLPAAAVVVTDGTVTMVWQGAIDVAIGGSLHYRITLQPVTAQGLLPPSRPWWVIPAWTAGGAAGGAILALLVVAITSTLK